MWITNLPPFIPFFVAGVAVLLLPARFRALILLLPLWGGANLYFTHEAATGVTVSMMMFDLQLMQVDKLSVLFGYLFHLAAFIGLLYALHVKSKLQLLAAVWYAGSGLGAVFSGDLISLFMFWELLAVTSVWLVWARNTSVSRRAGNRYLMIQVLSGLLLLSGILILSSQEAPLTLTALPLDSVAAWLIFIAFGIKCAFPLLHTWLTDAYSQATATGTVFLSAFTTKVAVFALARMFAGTELLVYIGVTMACFPIFYAVIENDLRKVLAYSLINQLGFMVVGVGIGTALALNGAVAHAFTDVIFKGLLFMTMGAVLHRVGHTLGSDLGGLYKTMPKTAICCIIGAASISAFPLFSGFVSKSMVMSAMLESGYDYLWLAMLFASAGVFHHAGIKIPYFAFFAHDSGLRPKEAPANMLAAMMLAAVLCIAIGSYPHVLYSLLPWDRAYTPYDLTHTLTQLQLLFFSALAFVWLQKQGLYPPELRSVNIDSEWFYRRMLVSGAMRVRHTVTQTYRAGSAMVTEIINDLIPPETSSSYSVAELTRRMAGILILVLIVGYIANLIT